MTTTTIYTVTYPRTPGAQPTDTIHATLRDARRHAATYSTRHDLTRQDVAIRVYRGAVSPANYIRCEYAGPCR